MKLFVQRYVSKEEREKQSLQTNMQWKTSKKKCNLYVTNFPEKWTETELTNIFKTYGEIESIKLDNNIGTNYCFVCFTKPESAMVAKQALNGSNFDG